MKKGIPPLSKGPPEEEQKSNSVEKRTHRGSVGYLPKEVPASPRGACLEKKERAPPAEKKRTFRPPRTGGGGSRTITKGRSVKGWGGGKRREGTLEKPLREDRLVERWENSFESFPSGGGKGGRVETVQPERVLLQKKGDLQRVLF